MGRALEIGAGSGTMAAQLLALHPKLQMVITDLDDSMLSGAREAVSTFGERARIETADATDLPYDDRSFDAVFSFIMLHHVIEWEKALAEAARVLKPGGRLIAYDVLNTGVMRLFHRLEGSYHRILELDPLKKQVSVLPFRHVVLRPGLFGYVVRLSAIRAEDDKR